MLTFFTKTNFNYNSKSNLKALGLFGSFMEANALKFMLIRI